MLPIAPLMLEHRVIERMIKVMKNKVESVNDTGTATLGLIDEAIDFFETYTTRCHHGKEEQILFPSLSTRGLPPPYKETMEELVDEHRRVKDLVGRLAAARGRISAHDATALSDIKSTVGELVRFYPVHIEKEDKHFFVPSIEYLGQHEQDDMLETFGEFDRKLLHEKYRAMVEHLEGKKK